MSREQRPVFELRIQSTPCDTPVEMRLKRALKCLLRSFNFRVLSLTQHGTVSDNGPVDHADGAAGTDK
jgi:hypothetical protein